MFTSEVAKLLGVSQSTIQRWVKQLGLPMEKNERGHYLFNNDDIELLKEIQEQIQKGTLLQDINPVHDKKARKRINQVAENDKVVERLCSKVADLETNLNAKADSVTSYQLLQHRSELEELQNQVKILMERIDMLENQIKPTTKIEMPLGLEQTKFAKKHKKKNIVSALFGF